eukprot:255486_1
MQLLSVTTLDYAQYSTLILILLAVGICLFVWYLSRSSGNRNTLSLNIELCDEYRHILILGSSCSGKSTLSNVLRNKYKEFKIIALDDYYWQPHAQWTHKSNRQFRHTISTVIKHNKSNAFIVDGCYLSMIKDIILPNIDCIIWLDYDFPTVWFYAWKRTIYNILYQTPTCNGNTESLWRIITNPTQFIPIWVWRKYDKRQRTIRTVVKEYHHIKCLRFTAPQQLYKSRSISNQSTTF